MKNKTKQKNFATFWQRFLAVFLVGMLSITIFPGVLSASAAEVTNAITGVTISEVNGQTVTSSTEVHKWDSLTIETTWAVPDTATAGDTFALNLPSEVTGKTATFTLYDSEGNVVGTGEVKSDQIVVTLGDYVNNHSNVHGTLEFSVYATTITTNNTLTWTVPSSGVTWDTLIPGEGIIGQVSNAPSSSGKWGWQDINGYINWELVLVKEQLTPDANGDVTIVDTYDPRLIYNGVLVDKIATSTYPNPVREAVPTSDYTVSVDEANHTFTLVLHHPVSDGSYVYDINYDMLPADDADVKNGDVFDNKAVINSTTTLSQTVTYQNSGGTGVGEVGSISIIKTDKDTGEALEGAEFEVIRKTTGLVVGTITTDAEGKGSLSNLVYDTYEIAEKTPPTGYVLSTETYEAEVNSTTAVNVTITNTKEKEKEPEVGSLEIRKKVTGSGGDLKKEFTFVVTFSDGKSYPYEGSKEGMVASGGSILLSHGQSVIITDIPVGVQYTVEEQEANKDGYTTLATGESGTIKDGETEEVVIVNHKDQEPNKPPTGDNTPPPTDDGGTPPPSKTLSGHTTPQTGDDFNFLLWMILVGVSGMFIGGASLVAARKHSVSRGK